MPRYSFQFSTSVVSNFWTFSGKVKESFSNNLNIFTNYIKQNVNEIINKRINNLKKNQSEEKICNNYYNNNGKKDIKFNVVLLDNWNNIKINGYNPLNNYSIFQIKTEINDIKMKNKILYLKNITYIIKNRATIL